MTTTRDTLAIAIAQLNPIVGDIAGNLAKARAARAGVKVALGIRAEASRLVAPGTPGSFPAMVDFVEELGAGRVVHTDLDGLSFAVAFSEPTKLRPGETVGILVDPASVHLYSIETGVRLDRTAAASWLATQT